MLEELGIEPDKIVKKFIATLTLRGLDSDLVKEDDMACVLAVCVAFGALLLCRGKIEFGNIYGFGLCGSFAICALINLLTRKGVYVQFYSTICILGSCLLPFTFLAAAALFMDMLNPIGVVFEFLIVAWASIAATRMFEIKHDMTD